MGTPNGVPALIDSRCAHFSVTFLLSLCSACMSHEIRTPLVRIEKTRSTSAAYSICNRFRSYTRLPVSLFAHIISQNCVIGMSSLLIEETDLNPMQAELLLMIATSGELLLTIVNDVLDYSKLESGNIEIVKTRSSLQETLSSTIHSMNLKGTTTNVSVRPMYDPNVPEFFTCDMRRLSQVLYNLISTFFFNPQLFQQHAKA